MRAQLRRCTQPNERDEMLQSIFTSSAWRQLVEDHPATPVAISTVGIFHSRYVFANQAYLDLVGHSWPDLSDRNLVGPGAALSTAERDRRLFLLDTAGSYRDEKAIIRHSSGRTIEVLISAWRFTVEESALDLEIFRAAAGDEAAPPTRYPASGAVRAKLLPDIARGLTAMEPAARRTLMLRMLMAVSEGAILLGMMLAPHMPAARYGLRLRKRLQRHIVESPLSSARISLDFEAYDDDEVEAALLEIAGEIWALIRFSRHPEASRMLRSMVEPYTGPPDIIRGKPKAWLQEGPLADPPAGTRAGAAAPDAVPP